MILAHGSWQVYTTEWRLLFNVHTFVFSLEPDEDPLGVLLMIDFYALQSEQFSFLIRLFEEWEVIQRLCVHVLSMFPSVVFSLLSPHLEEEHWLYW